eukprot:3686836-Ditylum_brightwellii.AAC.1
MVDLDRREGVFGIDCGGGCTNLVDKQTNKGNRTTNEMRPIGCNTAIRFGKRPARRPEVGLLETLFHQRKNGTQNQEEFYLPQEFMANVSECMVTCRLISTGLHHLDKKEYKKLMSPFLNTILPKLGLNCHYPRVVLHGAKKYGGFQMA